MVTSPGSRGVIVTLEGQKFRQGTMSAVEAYLISDVRLQHFFIYLVIKEQAREGIVHIVFGVSRWMGRPRKRLKGEKKMIG